MDPRSNSSNSRNSKVVRTNKYGDPIDELSNEWDFVNSQDNSAEISKPGTSIDNTDGEVSGSSDRAKLSDLTDERENVKNMLQRMDIRLTICAASGAFSAIVGVMGGATIGATEGVVTAYMSGLSAHPTHFRQHISRLSRSRAIDAGSKHDRACFCHHHLFVLCRLVRCIFYG